MKALKEAFEVVIALVYALGLTALYMCAFGLVAWVIALALFTPLN